MWVEVSFADTSVTVEGATMESRRDELYPLKNYNKDMFV
jgi:hypothetical protein